MSFHPADGAPGRSHLRVLVAFAEDLDALSVMQHADLLPHLSDSAEHRSDFFADESLSLRFVLWTEHPGSHAYQAEQRHSNEQLPFHARFTNAGTLGTTMLFPFVISSASLFRLLEIVPESAHVPETPVTAMLFC